MLLDPLLDETLWLRDGLGAWAYEVDAARDPYEHEAGDPRERGNPPAGRRGRDGPTGER